MRQLATNAAKIPDVKNIEFKRLRHHLGWSQHTLAAKLACPQAFISNYEIGKFEIPEVYLQTLRDLVKSSKMKDAVVHFNEKQLTQDQIEFKKIRHKLNLTQKQLSEKIGLAQSTIGAIENGTTSAVKCNRLQILRDFDAKVALIPATVDLTNTAIEFKRLRNFLGLSRRQLSEKLDLKLTHYITRWEDGERHIPSEMFQKLRDLVAKHVGNKFFFVKNGETIYTSFHHTCKCKTIRL
jgi:transcriptional regulator with XRE-family HTH domain